MLREHYIQNFTKESYVRVAFISNSIRVKRGALHTEEPLTALKTGINEEEHALEEGVASRFVWVIVNNIDEHGVK